MVSLTLTNELWHKVTSLQFLGSGTSLSIENILWTVKCTKVTFTCIEELALTVFLVESPINVFCRELVVCILKHCTHYTKCHETMLFHFQDKVWKFNSCWNPFLELLLTKSQQHNLIFYNRLHYDSLKILILAGIPNLSNHVLCNHPSCRDARPHLLLSWFLRSSHTVV